MATVVYLSYKVHDTDHDQVKYQIPTRRTLMTEIFILSVLKYCAGDVSYHQQVKDK